GHPPPPGRPPPLAAGGAQDGTTDRIDLRRPAGLAILLHRRAEFRRDAFDPLGHCGGVDQKPSAVAAAAPSRMHSRSLERQTGSATTPPNAEPRNVVVSAIGASAASFSHRTAASLSPMDAAMPASTTSAGTPSAC